MATLSSPRTQCCCCAVGVFAALFGVFMLSAGICIVLNVNYMEVDTSGLPPDLHNDSGKRAVGIILICVAFFSLGLSATVSIVYFTMCNRKPYRAPTPGSSENSRNSALGNGRPGESGTANGRALTGVASLPLSAADKVRLSEQQRPNSKESIRSGASGSGSSRRVTPPGQNGIDGVMFSKSTASKSRPQHHGGARGHAHGHKRSKKSHHLRPGRYRSGLATHTEEDAELAKSVADLNGASASENQEETASGSGLDSGQRRSLSRDYASPSGQNSVPRLQLDSTPMVVVTPIKSGDSTLLSTMSSRDELDNSFSTNEDSSTSVLEETNFSIPTMTVASPSTTAIEATNTSTTPLDSTRPTLSESVVSDALLDHQSIPHTLDSFPATTNQGNVNDGGEEEAGSFSSTSEPRSVPSILEIREDSDSEALRALPYRVEVIDETSSVRSDSERTQPSNASLNPTDSTVDESASTSHQRPHILKVLPPKGGDLDSPRTHGGSSVNDDENDVLPELPSSSRQANGTNTVSECPVEEAEFRCESTSSFNSAFSYDGDDPDRSEVERRMRDLIK